MLKTWSLICTRGNSSRKRRQVLPVDRGAVIVEQARARERIAAGAQRAERDAAVRQAAERGEQGRGDRLAHVDAAADEQDVHLAELVEGDGRRDVEAAAREYRPAVEAHDRPFVNGLAHDPVRHAQRLDRVRNRDQRVIRQGQEPVAALLQGSDRIHAVAEVSHGHFSMPSAPPRMSDSDISLSLLGLPAARHRLHFRT